MLLDAARIFEEFEDAFGSEELEDMVVQLEGLALAPCPILLWNCSQ